MARAYKKLTQRFIETVTAPGRYADGGGLYLVVDKGVDDKVGAKRWALLVTVRGRRRELGLGAFRLMTLPEAREKALESRKALDRGDDPKKPKESPPTFSAAATAMIAEMAPGWRGRDTEAHWKRSLLTYAKDIAGVPIDLVDTDDVVRMVKVHWTKRPETGRKLRQRIEALLDYAAVKRWRDPEMKNPARFKGHLAKLLPRQTKRPVHHRAIPYDAAPTFMDDLGKRGSMSARALEWTIFTAAREGMTRHTVWGDVKGDLWVIPANRMKQDEHGEFRCPLTPQALAVLDTVRMKGQKASDLIFPGAKAGRPMSDQTMDALLDRMGIDATPHGFRSTFRDWAGDMTEHPREVAEAALAHVVGDDVERAYRGGDALKKRRLLMQDWSDYLRPRPEAEEVPPEE
ncbi:tyrosine-type recombinase/integrase [Brevundimonas sp. SL161]|uniref:tyrosine-type recombinase/integrase n=1 Tax=Brevundimonas sp. SL161 TaxID=2804613 RepID=UPI003CE8445A